MFGTARGEGAEVKDASLVWVSTGTTRPFVDFEDDELPDLTTGLGKSLKLNFGVLCTIAMRMVPLEVEVVLLDLTIRFGNFSEGALLVLSTIATRVLPLTAKVFAGVIDLATGVLTCLLNAGLELRIIADRVTTLVSTFLGTSCGVVIAGRAFKVCRTVVFDCTTGMAFGMRLATLTSLRTISLRIFSFLIGGGVFLFTNSSL